jgi:endonuclease/exonuclease/phosphatase family metal-dependent hydrolase
MKRWMGLLCLFSLNGSAQAVENSRTPLTFSVLTYQVQSASSENMPVIGQKLDAFDIAGIQGCMAHCEDLLNAAHHPNKYHFNERPHWWNRRNSGLASLSNFPLIEIKKIHFKAQIGLTSDNANKGVLLMRYDVNGHILDLYNTQMQPGEEKLSAAARQFQTLELVQYVAMESPAEHTVILIGDFNMSGAKPTIKSKLNLQDPAESLHSWVDNQFDRVLFRSGSNTVFKPIAWKDMSEVFVDIGGEPLAASTPIAVHFSLE